MTQDDRIAGAQAEIAEILERYAVEFCRADGVDGLVFLACVEDTLEPEAESSRLH